MISGSAREIWEAALGELQVQVSKPNYRTWLERTIGLSNQANQFIVGVPNVFVAEYLDRNLRSLIEKTLIGLIGPGTKVTFQINGKPSANPPASPITPAARLNPRYTFDGFVAGECNRLAREAALSVLQNPGHFNPLFIYSSPGLGKTHLLQAIGHIALARNARVLYASAEQFTNEFINSLRERKTIDFNNRYRSVDMLLIDDIQFIVGKEQTEESFFHTFNELHNLDRQIVMTSDRPPKSLPLLEERLCSRFEWGLTTSIQPPDYQTRLAILDARARQEEMNIPGNVLELIAARDYHNVRELEGALNRVSAYALLVAAPPTPALAAKALRDVAEEDTRRMLAPAAIIEAVARCFELSPEDIRGRKRQREITLARHLAMYLIRRETGCSLAQVGRELGNRDHSTVIHACETITARIDNNSYLKRKLTDIEQAMKQGQS